MALEIERRFLVAGDGWRPHSRWSQELHQGYLALAPDGLTVRVRTGGEQAWLTLKSRAEALVRQEFEYPIPLADARQLLELGGPQLVKIRHGLDLPGGEWVLDVFGGANAPLVVAEVELATPTSPVAIPDWCVREITDRHELSNAALARQPLARWPEPARRELLRWLQGASFSGETPASSS